ncbi:unnamed protein product [Rotaria socialis]|uniref:Uncharacterized protein n=1 Tax=Rotaria socialis TaxID=392032 RepID=A0A817W2E8_9BILA|nr:unnamed protein product [Rotaria socialis]
MVSSELSGSKIFDWSFLSLIFKFPTQTYNRSKLEKRPCVTCVSAVLHVQKLWRSKVKACKRAVQQCHDNSSLHDQPNTEINADFVDYFEDTFIGRVIRNNRRRAPRFSVNMWNCFSRLDEELPRTNNSSEGWNRAIKNSARENPSIYESIADLRIEQHSNLILAEQLEAGVVKTRKRIKYEMLNEQLQQLASNFYLLPRDIYFKKARALFNF